MTHLKYVSAAALAMALPMSAAAAPIINNGSFETIPGPLSQSHLGSTASWDYFAGGIMGWTTAPDGMLEIQSDATLGYIDAQDGNLYAELDSNGNSSFYQDVALTGGRYVLSFWFALRDASEDPNWVSTTMHDTNDISYGVEGLFTNQIVAGPNSGFVLGEWTLMTAEFVAPTDDTYRIRFAATGTSDTYGGFVDNVALSPVPVPAAGLMLLSALGAGAMMRRKQG